MGSRIYFFVGKLLSVSSKKRTRTQPNQSSYSVQTRIGVSSDFDPSSFVQRVLSELALKEIVSCLRPSEPDVHPEG